MNHPIADVVPPLLKKLATEMPPETFRSFLIGGVIARTVGNMPDEYWQEFSKIKICNNPGCNCYEMSQKLMDVLAIIRADYQKTMRIKEGAKS